MQRPYGATAAQGQAQPQPVGSRLGKPGTPRTDIQILVVAAALLVPWFVFTLDAALVSFSMHYRHAGLCWFVVELAACLVAVSGVMAFLAVRARRAGDAARDPTWYVLISASLAFAWMAGLALGMVNYSKHMQRVYDVTSLEMYSNVDPARTSGSQVLDAGSAVFARGSRLDAARSYGFHAEGETYCVAPIVSGNEALVTYDFWAVGTDCCEASETGPGFTCGSASSPAARGGVRVMDEGATRFYRLAVDQAELASGIRADHPVFFHWVEDPIAEVNQRQDSGLRLFLLGSLTHFAFQFFLVALVVIRASARNMGK